MEHKHRISFEEFWAFWDAHSTADYEDLMEEVNMQVNLESNKIYQETVP